MGIETLSIIQLYALLFDEQEMTYSEIETDLEMLKSGGTEIPDNYVALLRQYCTRPLS
ncbi:hypothetical protein SAMN04488691_10214 [Haloferax larsenii]|uniref:Uncharacterized protein n=2 Tax=Haloferax larsenii TaxID=302484 RepID=A0A1H7KID0_HALLR|nr:hypothetical protein SAMN04488691_10214 [Haloferax larsenii]